jgi:hypothetical protein
LVDPAWLFATKRRFLFSDYSIPNKYEGLMKKLRRYREYWTSHPKFDIQAVSVKFGKSNPVLVGMPATKKWTQRQLSYFLVYQVLPVTVVNAVAMMPPSCVIAHCQV